MSESDDSDLLADIRALDEALALSVDNQPESGYNYSEPNSPSTEVNSEESLDDCLPVYLNENIDRSCDVYELNKRLIKGLTIAKKKLTTLIQDCEKKIELLDEKIKMRSDESGVSSKLMVTCAGMPYFKDKKHFSAPKNNDTKLKETRGELFLLSLAKPCRWSGKDRETLLRAISDEAIESVLSGKFCKEVNQEPSKKESISAQDRAKKSVLVLPRNFSEMVGAVGKKEFDWYKIAATDFDNRHSPGECRAMWNVYLHPDIEKREWTNSEDKVLLRYARECKYQDWDTIATKLGTKRSAYQCFIRYNTIKKMPFSGHPWHKLEDKHLLRVINRFKIGNYIPWSEVANYLRHRTKQQIYTRWMYRKAPHLKKGRFNYFETNTLVNAIRQYGLDFSKISNAVMPYRTSVQLSEHYQTIITNKNGNVWTVDNDMKLLHLHKKYGNDWSKIASHFSSKSRTQVRHRHNALVKYIMKGVGIESIPRQSSLTNGKNINSSSSSGLGSNCNDVQSKKESTSYIIHISDIQSRLFETLSFFPSANSTESQKELNNPRQLAYNTTNLYNVLNLLDANLHIPEDSFNYVHLTIKEKELFVSLRNYIDARMKQTQNHELIEKFRLRMFGSDSDTNQDTRFIPPLPFGGYIRTRNIKNAKSIDCDLNFSEKFLIEAPNQLITPFYGSSSLVNIEEEIQFHKLSQFLIGNYHSNDQVSTKSYDKESVQTSSRYNKKPLSKIKLRKCKTKAEHTNNTCDINSTQHIDENSKEKNILNAIIPPNYATLLGFKNLLLWKLLYDHQSESQSISQQTKCTENPEYQKAYRTLKTRLLQLFKFPIGLSNTILKIHGPEALFLTKEEQNHKNNSMKRKSNDTNSANPIKRSRVNILADSNFQQNTNVEIVDYSKIRNATCKKYKVIIK